jgi:hypothetical protein
MDTDSNSFVVGGVMDLFKVNIINIAAISFSLTKTEEWVRLLGMIAALIYTVLKILQLLNEMKSKSPTKGAAASLKEKVTKMK